VSSALYTSKDADYKALFKIGIYINYFSVEECFPGTRALILNIMLFF
jgi:hypothetical protein